MALLSPLSAAPIDHRPLQLTWSVQTALVSHCHLFLPLQFSRHGMAAFRKMMEVGATLESGPSAVQSTQSRRRDESSLVTLFRAARSTTPLQL